MVLDELDREIIKVMQNKARLSYAQIGREVNLSPSAVRERIQKLEDESVIIKHSSLIDHQKVGYSLSAYISISFKSDSLRPFLNSIHEFPEITECSRITGANCLIMKVILKDNSHLEKILDKLLPYGRTSTSVVLSDVISNGVVIPMID